MKLEVDSNKVLQAAASCPQARYVLQVLFPDVFVTKTYKDVLRPGTRWKHRNFKGEYVYIGDSPELGRAIGQPHSDSFFSLNEYGSFVHTHKNVDDIEVIYDPLSDES